MAIALKEGLSFTSLDQQAVIKSCRSWGHLLGWTYSIADVPPHKSGRILLSRFIIQVHYRDIFWTMLHHFHCGRHWAYVGSTFSPVFTYEKVGGVLVLSCLFRTAELACILAWKWSLPASSCNCVATEMRVDRWHDCWKRRGLHLLALILD